MFELPESAAIGAEKSKHSMLPFLIVLFLISYGLLALLVVEQAHTIDAQRGLIRQLVSDSVELTTLKGKALQKSHTPVTPKPQTPSSQVQPPSSQREAPSSRVGPGNKASNANKAGRLQKRLPEKPPRDTSDTADERRNLRSI